MSGGVLRVDPVACDGVGACALAAPALVDLDRWGYPLLPRRSLTPAELAPARAAARACPRRALWVLEPATSGRAGPVSGHAG